MSNATFLLTNKSLLLARDSLGEFIDTGVEIQNIPIDKIRDVSISEKNQDGYIIQKLKVELIKGRCIVEMPLVDNKDSINNFFNFVQRLVSKIEK